MENNKINMKDIYDEFFEVINQMANVTWNGHEIVIKKCISANEVNIFVDYVNKICFDNDGQYHPERKDFAIRLITIGVYTNISIGSDVDIQYGVLYGTDLYNTIISNVDIEQYNMLINSCDEQITHTNRCNLNALQLATSNLVSQIDTLGEKFGDLTSNLTKDDLEMLVKSLGNLNIDESKLMGAYIDYKNK